MRVFAGRTSTGVRGIKLGKGDEVISMSILKSVDATPDERSAYLKMANKLRGAEDEDGDIDTSVSDLPEDRFKVLQDNEEFLLTVTNKGFGKRTSAYEYRVTGRGGQGVWTSMGLTKKRRRSVCDLPGYG